MKLPFDARWLLPLALLLGLALRVPGWFTQDIKDNWVTFEPDEGQHVHAATHRYNDLYDGEKVGDYNDSPWNVRGYGHLIATTAYGWYALQDNPPSWEEFVLLGRKLSTLFSLLLILSVWLLARAGGLSPPYAGVAALLMAACDANATISHYCLPAAGYVFWCYLALLGALRLGHKSSSFSGLALLALGSAGAVAFKFDVLPLAWGGLYLLHLAFMRRAIPWWYVPVGVGLVLAFVGISWYGWSWDNIQSTFKGLSKLNREGVPVEDHFRDNLIVYPAGVLAGVGLPAFGFALFGLMRLWGSAAGAKRVEKKAWTNRHWTLLYLTGWIVSEFIVRWSVDTAFIRRVNVFMPAVCILCAYGLHELRKHSWLSLAVVIYTVLFGIVGQSNHWFDTRYEMREFVNNELPEDAKIGVSGYVKLEGLRKTDWFMNGNWDYAVIHETHYSRYWKSMTTPFGLPECCDGVYNCKSEKECARMQSLLSGTDEKARLLKAFRPRNWFPERIAYAHFFGYYETFLGETLVFERKAGSRES
ncbi:hypothetical protein FUA23_06020 [Neolewinella aurantiaca]|uniref:Glycosyltransferase RgtA/B/C/D-like domain-containing protein n=1 Tax=Neolewinella aurantiaca TaxID=2602767 RepID=A0A5C7FVK1_9BACT|nr:hypothetical protein [Neolewinella aurantiaca]TXF90649.1 hypothetical protein FUA23_06020 [Neolewinella aurantiaca]